MFKKNNLLALFVLINHASIIITGDEKYPLVRRQEKIKIVCNQYEGLLIFSVLALDFYVALTPESLAPQLLTQEARAITKHPYTACYNGHNIGTKQQEIFRYLKELHRQQEKCRQLMLSHASIEAYLTSLKVVYKKATPA